MFAGTYDNPGFISTVVRFTSPVVNSNSFGKVTVDMMHTHPFIADGSLEIQFDLTFPRPRTYRVWVQFQRSGVVNTVRFDIPVKP
jgi:hypothetical protein